MNFASNDINSPNHRLNKISCTYGKFQVFIVRKQKSHKPIKPPILIEEYYVNDKCIYNTFKMVSSA